MQRYLSLLILTFIICPAPLRAGSLDDYYWHCECDRADAWTKQTSWLGNPCPASRATADDDSTVTFRVDQSSHGMKWSLNIPTVPIETTRWLTVRYRAQNLNTTRTDYFIYIDDGRRSGQLDAIRLCDTKSDGRWHTTAVDLSALTTALSIQGLAIQVQASSASSATVELDRISLVASPPADAEIIEHAPPVPPRDDWSARFEADGWQPQPSWLENPCTTTACSVERHDGTTQFRVQDVGTGMKWSHRLPAPVELAGHRYLSIRYRAQGANRRSDYLLAILGSPTNPDDPGYMTAIESTEIVSDGRWHTIEVDARRAAERFPTITTVALQLQATRPDAWLEISDLRLTNDRRLARLSDSIHYEKGADFAGHTIVSLARAEKFDRDAWQRHLRLADWFDSQTVTVEGIPFQLETLTTSGIAEETSLRFETSARTSEAYLLLAAALIGQDEPAYGGGQFRRIRDVDRFRLRLEYEDGTVDECLPMNVATGRFQITRGVQVVVAPADPTKTLRAISLQDRCHQAAFAVAGITLRTDGRVRFPAAHEDEPSPFTTHCKGVRTPLDATIFYDGIPGLRQLTHRPTGRKLLVDPSPLIELRVDGKEIAADSFEAIDRLAGTEPQWKWYRIGDFDRLLVGVNISLSGDDSLSIEATVRNEGDNEHRIVLTAPRVGPYRLDDDADQSYYLLPRRGALLDRRDGNYAEPYCGHFPLQFIDTFNPAGGCGISLRTEDTTGRPKTYLLDKKLSDLTVGVRYDATLTSGETLQTARAIVTATNGDWRRGFNAYRHWASKHLPPVWPRKPWFREIFNFRQRFLWRYDPLYDPARGTFDLTSAIDEAQREFGGIDYLHLFDWGNLPGVGRVYGRTGDLSPYDKLAGGRDAFRRAIAEVRNAGVPVGLYIEGYLLQENGRLGQQKGKAWQLIDRHGNGRYWPDSTEMFVCPAVEQWREVQASTYATKVRELAVDGMYIDQFGFARSHKDCWSTEHGHAVPSRATTAERECTRIIHERIAGVKSGVAIYTEESPVDVTTRYQDGSFTYAMLSARQSGATVPLNLTRFALPDFKTIEILFCDRPIGSWATGVRWIFFNGEAIWLEGPARSWFKKETRETIRRCYAILRQHRDAFTSDAPEPLVATEMSDIYANRFPAGRKTVYTLYNAKHRTARGTVLRFPISEGATYFDAWHDRPATTRIDGEDLLIETEIPPRGVGCIVITRDSY